MKTSAFTNIHVWHVRLHFKSGEKNKNVNDGTNPTAGIDKDYYNGFTAILNFPKIEVVLNLL